MGGAGYVANMVLNMRNAYRILFGTPERKKPLEV
jgi:hypothetical protein